MSKAGGRGSTGGGGGKAASSRGSLDLPNGTYDGELKEGNRHGQGAMRYASGGNYEGGFKEGKKHGKGKCLYPDGDTYEGEWNMGVWNGRGRVVWANGNTYDGEFIDGQLNGRGKFVWDNGDAYEGESCLGQKHGRGVQTYAIDGIPTLIGCDYSWSAGDKYDGGFKGDVRHGACTYTFFNGETFNCWWASGRCPEFTARQRAVKAAPDDASARARAAADQAAVKAVADSMVRRLGCSFVTGTIDRCFEP